MSMYCHCLGMNVTSCSASVDCPSRVKDKDKATTNNNVK